MSQLTFKVKSPCSPHAVGVPEIADDVDVELLEVATPNAVELKPAVLGYE